MLAGASDLPDRVLRLLSSRAVAPGDLAAYHGDPADGLHDPRQLPDAAVVVERMRNARARAERILVFGDFDADGLTGLAILTRALRDLGLDAAPYVPSRHEEGHGLSLRAIEHARSEGRSLLITVDCGTSSVSEIHAAAEAGIDVIVTDHHRPPPVLPHALAIVNPHLETSAYPDARLAGSGVAFKVAQLLWQELEGDTSRAFAYADLALIGTIADIAALSGENRCIARIGLPLLNDHPRPGIAALLASAGIRPGTVDGETIAFAVAPRLNAVGRVGDGTPAANLLLAETDEEAAALAAQLESANGQRRDMTAAALIEARIEADRDPDRGAIVVAGAWPVGVIGLVAGKLAEERRRPAVVFSTTTDPWRGSARGVEGFDLAASFAACADLFERYGGHAAAAGCNLRADLLGAFLERFLALPMPQSDPVSGGATLAAPELLVDLVLPGLEVDYRLHRELRVLEPAGPGQPEVLLGVQDLIVTRVRAAGAGHAQLTLKRGLEVLDAIAFDRADLVELVHEGDRVDLVARLASRTFGGFESLQLEVRDVAPAGHLEALMERRSLGSATPAGVAG